MYGHQAIKQIFNCLSLLAQIVDLTYGGNLLFFFFLPTAIFTFSQSDLMVDLFIF